MSLDFEFPSFLSPEQVDDFLLRGWFRMRENVFTTHYYIRDASLLSTVWLRSILKNYQFSKQQRKHLRSLHRKYSIKVDRLTISDEQEELYQSYLTTASGERSSTLQGVLGDDGGAIFDSHVMEIRDPNNGNCLVALSIFDVGLHSIQSIIGIYDPAYSEESLGVYSMMLEVEYAIQQGFHYYYIGYFTPGFLTFDYKLRLKNLEFFDPDVDEWYPMGQFDKSRLWSSQHIERLTKMQDQLLQYEIPSRMILNVHYDTIILHGLGDIYVDEPMLLDMRSDTSLRMGHLCYFSISKQRYVLVLADYESRKGISTDDDGIEDKGYPIHRSLVRKTHSIAEGNSVEEILSVIYGEIP